MLQVRTSSRSDSHDTGDQRATQHLQTSGEDVTPLAGDCLNQYADRRPIQPAAGDPTFQ
jgi:hypothetical protein